MPPARFDVGVAKLPADELELLYREVVNYLDADPTDVLRKSIAKGLEAETCICEDTGCDPGEHWELCTHRLAARVRAREWG